MNIPGELAAAVDDALDVLSAHHHALFLTFLELLRDGQSPLEALELLAVRSGETTIYLCRVMLDELQHTLR
jgi:hypothetical protein